LQKKNEKESLKRRRQKDLSKKVKRVHFFVLKYFSAHFELLSFGFFGVNQ
jgi:hypothetical protein